MNTVIKAVLICISVTCAILLIGTLYGLYMVAKFFYQ